MKEKITMMICSILLSLGITMSAYAGQWISDAYGWKWMNDDGRNSVNTWQWIDGNFDGIAESYYFDAKGYCLLNTVTPDGYIVDSSGAWIVNGTVQTKQVAVIQNLHIIDAQEINSNDLHSTSMVKIFLSDGTVVSKIYELGFKNVYSGWWSDVQLGDLTGDGYNELIINLCYVGSTYAATDVYVYSAVDNQLCEIFQVNCEDISQYYPELQTCAGASIENGYLNITGTAGKYVWKTVQLKYVDGNWVKVNVIIES